MTFGTFPVGTIFYPTELNKYSQQSGWLFIIGSGTLTLLFSWFLIQLQAAYPGESFFTIAKCSLGKIMGTALFIFLIIYMVISCGLGLRILGNGAIVYLLFNTPLFPVLFSMMLIVIYTVSKGTLTVIRTNEFLNLIILTLPSIMLFMLTPKTDFTELIPILSQDADIINSSLIGSEPYILALLIVFLFPYIGSSKSLAKGLGWGIISLMIAMTLTFIFAVGMFGPVELNFINYPSIEMTRDFEVPLFERMEIVYMFFWIPIAFLAHVGTLYSATIGIKQMIPKSPYKIMTVILGTISLLIAFLLDDSEQLRYITTFMHPIFYTIWFLIFPFMYFMDRHRKKVNQHAMER